MFCYMFNAIFPLISILQISLDISLFSYQTLKYRRTFAQNTVLKVYFLHLFVLQIQCQNGGFWVKPNTFPGFPDSTKCLFILYYQVFRFNTNLIYDFLLLFWSSSSWKAFAFFFSTAINVFVFILFQLRFGETMLQNETIFIKGSLTLLF